MTGLALPRLPVELSGAGKRASRRCSPDHQPGLAERLILAPLGVVRRLFFPRQFIEGRLVAPFPIAIFRHVEFLMLVIFDAGAVLIAPSVPFSINATRFHRCDNTAWGSKCYNEANPIGTSAFFLCSQHHTVNRVTLITSSCCSRWHVQIANAGITTMKNKFLALTMLAFALYTAAAATAEIATLSSDAVAADSNK